MKYGPREVDRLATGRKGGAFPFRASPSILKTPASLARNPDSAAQDSRLSSAIGIARVLCILGIVYVHAWTGLPSGDLAQQTGTPQGILRWALIDLLGRGAVPLLSVVSGWLVAESLAKRGWRTFLAGKARTVLLPMVAWNAIAILLVSGAAWLGWIQAPLPTTLWWTIDELFCLASPNDINVQMSFLRDLFVCMALAPLLVRLPTWALGLAALGVLIWSVSGFAFVLLLRPAILLFFIAGIVARRHDLAARAAVRPMFLTGSAYALLAGVQIWLETVGIARGVNDPLLLASIDLVMRGVTALFFWTIAWRLAGSRLGPGLVALEPYAFLMFSAHLIMIWLGGPLIGRLTGPLGAPLYPVFLLAQPLLVLGGTLLLGRMLVSTSPTMSRLLSGGRLTGDNENRGPLNLTPRMR